MKKIGIADNIDFEIGRFKLVEKGFKFTAKNTITR